jgi:hypothetical protein
MTISTELVDHIAKIEVLRWKSSSFEENVQMIFKKDGVSQFGKLNFTGILIYPKMIL